MAEYTTEVSNLYEKNRSSSAFYRMEREMFDDFIGDVNGMTFLDAGCGAGTRLFTLMSKGAAEGFGVEYSQNMLDIALERAEKVPNLTFKQGDLVSMPFLGKKFDFVISEFVLCYAKNRDELRNMLTNCFKHVKSGGEFIATTSNPWQGANYLDHNSKFQRQYGVSYSGYDGTLSESQAVTVEFTLESGEQATATNHWYSPELYIQLLGEVGFVNARIYHPSECPPSMINVEDSIKDYLAEPDCFFILASAP